MSKKKNIKVTIETKLYEAIMQGTSKEQLGAVENLKKMREANMNLSDEIFNCWPGLLAKLVEFLSNDEQPELQLESARLLSDLIPDSFHEIKILINVGIVPQIIRLYKSNKSDLQELGVYITENICMGNFRERYFVLRSGIFWPLLE